MVADKVCVVCSMKVRVLDCKGLCTDCLVKEE